MIAVDVKETALLPEHFEKIQKGESIVLFDNAIAIAELKPLTNTLKAKYEQEYEQELDDLIKKSGKRPVGMLKGRIKIMPGAFDPMTEEEVNEWDESPSNPLHVYLSNLR